MNSCNTGEVFFHEYLIFASQVHFDCVNFKILNIGTWGIHNFPQGSFCALDVGFQLCIFRIGRQCPPCLQSLYNIQFCI